MARYIVVPIVELNVKRKIQFLCTGLSLDQNSLEDGDVILCHLRLRLS